MSELVYGTYILVWPALTLGVLAVICSAVIKDAVHARKSDRNVV
ncbi:MULTISPECIES: putative transporter small subunit [Marinobacter]|uniref:Transporter small subunit n=1 Tax=Marinobacter xiaoshiensis TaxID=3073652 RepID=A0ABU2HJY3_9GAMM|nr:MULTISPECIES: putative transporter small subunit [unclassified Marinobacter]MDS1311379.1 putative transporter small subunit [Marinobacter sp. F60267]